MSMARLVITAVTMEGRSKSEVARDYGVSRVWVQKLVRRFYSEGEVAFELIPGGRIRGKAGTALKAMSSAPCVRT